MNLVAVTGRLTRDPEISYTKGEKPLCIAKSSIAVARPYAKEGQQDADFFRFTLFGSGAEAAEKYLKKGTKIELRGRLESNMYEKEDGTKVSSVVIIGEEWLFAESKKAAAENVGEQNTQEPPVDNASAASAVPDGSLDEELPFV